jgi:hypothetical protein
MRKLILTLITLSTSITTSFASPTVGQVVLLKTSSSPARMSPAIVSKIISGDTVNLVAVADSTTDWPDPVNQDYTHGAWLYTSVAKGTAVGEWQESTIPAPLTDAMDAYAEGRLAVPTGWSSPARTLNSNYKPSSTRPVRVTVSGTWSGTLSATGSLGGTIQLLSDTASTPTTVCDDQQPAFSATLLVGVALTQVTPWKLTCLVPTDWNVRLSTSGTGTFAITSVTEATL